MKTKQRAIPEPEPANREPATLLDQIDLGEPGPIDGVVLGVLDSIDGKGVPHVSFSGSPGAVPAQATVALNRDDLGARVALMFVGGSPAKPMVLGKVRDSVHTGREAVIDGERLVFEAEKEILLRCGKASITLRRDGKIVIKGAHLINRSSGANKIKGASVQIN